MFLPQSMCFKRTLLVDLLCHEIQWPVPWSQLQNIEQLHFFVFEEMEQGMLIEFCAFAMLLGVGDEKVVMHHSGGQCGTC